jgi:hypothetical protein
VAEKQAANFCEYFDFVRREWTARPASGQREQAARDVLKKLLED